MRAKRNTNAHRQRQKKERRGGWLGDAGVREIFVGSEISGKLNFLTCGGERRNQVFPAWRRT
jgi:hypothetical protein